MITNLEAAFKEDVLQLYREKIPTLYRICQSDETLKKVVWKFSMIVVKQNMELEKGLLLMEKMAIHNEF